MLLKKGAVLAFSAEAVADLNTIKGLIRILGLDRRFVVIRFGEEVNRSMAQNAFPGFRFVEKFLSHHLRIGFNTEGPGRLGGDRRVIFNYTPHKFFSLSLASYSTKKRAAVRAAMRVGRGRKIMCVSCTGREEVLFVLRAVQGLRFSEKPILIFGLRRPDRGLAAELRDKGFKALDRHLKGRNLAGFSRADAVILNTTGEFFEFLRAADLAVIGHDRNLFEPAYLRVPILYFGAPLGMTRKEEEMAGIFGLIWRKNRLAKKFLDRNGGAKRIYPAKFSRQIEETLQNPAPFVRGGRKAIREFEEEMIPAARKRASWVLAKALQRI